MEAEGLARRIGQPPIVGRDLMRTHHEVNRQFWCWSDAAVDHAVLTGSIATTFGWPLHVGPNFNPRSLGIFLAKPTAPKCCGSPPALPPSRVLRFAP